MSIRKPYPTDVKDEEWSVVVPYLALVCDLQKQNFHGGTCRKNTVDDRQRTRRPPSPRINAAAFTGN